MRVGGGHNYTMTYTSTAYGGGTPRMRICINWFLAKAQRHSSARPMTSGSLKRLPGGGPPRPMIETIVRGWPYSAGSAVRVRTPLSSDAFVRLMDRATHGR